MSPSMLLSQLLPDVALAGHDPVLTGLVLDSRAVRPGNAFVAIAGFGAHGLGFVEQARAAGVDHLRVDCYAGGSGDLVRFYESCGYTRIAPFNVDGWPGMLLGRTL